MFSDKIRQCAIVALSVCTPLAMGVEPATCVSATHETALQTQPDVYGNVFVGNFVPAKDGVLALQGPVTNGVLVGSRWNGEPVMLVISEQRSIHEALATSGWDLQIAITIENKVLSRTTIPIIELDGVLIGSEGSVSVTAIAVCTDVNDNTWAIMPCQQGLSLMSAVPAAPSASSAPPPQGEDCMDYASAYAGTEPTCSGTPVMPGLWACADASKCRLQKCNWAARWNYYYCKCTTPEPIAPPPGVACPPGTSPCEVLYAGAVAACHAVYVYDISALCGVGSIFK